MSVDYAINFIAGAVSGAASVVVGHPLDTVKVRLQISDPSKYSGTLDCFKKMVSSEGTVALFRGMMSPMLFASVINAIVFSSYESCLATFQGETTARNNYDYIFVAGALSAIPSCIVLGPTDLIKIRLQKDSTEYKGTMDCLLKNFKRAGFRGLMQGTVATAVRDMPALGSYFASYHYLKLTLDPYVDETLNPFISGASAGIVSWIIAYPLDVVKTIIQAMPATTNNKEQSIFRIFHAMYSQQGGVKLLYRGLGASLIRSIPVNGVVFPVYEYTNILLRKVTGYGLGPGQSY